MKGNVNIQKLYIDLPNEQARMLKFLKAKNFISAFQNIQFPKKKSVEITPQMRLYRNQKNKIGADTLSLSHQISLEKEKMKKELENMKNMREFINFGQFRQKDAIYKFTKQMFHVHNESEGKLNQHHSCTHSDRKPLSPINKRNKPFKIKIPKFFETEHENTLDKKDNSSNNTHQVNEVTNTEESLLTPPSPKPKHNGIKEIVKLNDQNIVIFKSDLNKYIPDLNSNNEELKYEIYELNDKIYKYKKKPFQF